MNSSCQAADEANNYFRIKCSKNYFRRKKIVVFFSVNHSAAFINNSIFNTNNYVEATYFYNEQSDRVTVMSSMYFYIKKYLNAFGEIFESGVVCVYFI